MTVRFRIILVDPPTGVDFGVQKGRGSHYETIHKQRSVAGSDLCFEFELEVQKGPAFRGPLVQGTPDQRFVYLDIGTSAGQMDSPWTRRLKVPLTGITAEMIREGAVLETRVPGTAKDGGPACATVKPFPGWRLAAYPG